jgi:vacuolar-type H+-ATPase subunit F/Vma7
MIGIDFTGSNGRPDSYNSLHYFDPTGKRMNQYQQAIRAIGDILSEYTADNSYDVFGFGARLPNNSISHCFPVTFAADAKVPGIEGVLGCYRNALPQLRLSGPTLFTPILQTALQQSSTLQNDTTSHNYKIVLMLTDGVINDMDQTIESIVRGSEMPLSIIIIGIGNADFSAMETLDGDDMLLRSNISGQTAKRDIVQFVPFNKFANQHYSALAKETLAEIPAQITGFYKNCNLVPNPPPNANPSPNAGGNIPPPPVKP